VPDKYESGNQLLEKDRTTLALALFMILVGAIASLSIWIRMLAALFAVFLVYWGRDSETTEAAVSSIPVAGPFLIRGLHQLDLIISPRDQVYEDRVRKTVAEYDRPLMDSLRRVLETRNAFRIPDDHCTRFRLDGLIEYSHGAPGPIKPELRDPIRRILRELGERDLEA
jgi:hypothetical protein